MKTSCLGSAELKMKKVPLTFGETALHTALGMSCSKKVLYGLKVECLPAESFVLSWLKPLKTCPSDVSG